MGRVPRLAAALSLDFFLTTGGLAPSGLADGGVDELEAVTFDELPTRPTDLPTPRCEHLVRGTRARR